MQLKQALERGEVGTSVVEWEQAPEDFRTLLDDPNTWLTLMIILAVALGVLLLMVLFLRKRISLAIALIEQGGKAVSSITSALFFPVVPWVLQLAVVAYTAMVVLYLATSGVAMYKVHGLQQSSGICQCSEGVGFKVRSETCPSNLDNTKTCLKIPLGVLHRTDFPTFCFRIIPYVILQNLTNSATIV